MLYKENTLNCVNVKHSEAVKWFSYTGLRWEDKQNQPPLYFPPELSVSSKIHSSPLSKDTLCIYCGFNLTLPLFTSALAFPHGRENLFFSLGQGSKLSQGNFVLTRLDFGESKWRTVEGVKIARLQIRIQPPAWGKITLSKSYCSWFGTGNPLHRRAAPWLFIVQVQWNSEPITRTGRFYHELQPSEFQWGLCHVQMWFRLSEWEWIFPTESGLPAVK